MLLARVRHRLILLLIAVYGVTSLAAQGLHLLPGCGHTHGQVGQTRDAEPAGPQCCSHTSTLSPVESTACSDEPERSPLSPLDDDDCSICRYCAMGQSVTLSAALPFSVELWSPSPLLQLGHVSAPLPWAYHGRAPPALS
jgi:hypothetical protein